MNHNYYFICNNSFIGKVVHHKDCKYLRNNQKKFLGTFSDYPEAVATARKTDPETDHCQACLEQRHKADGSLTTETSKQIQPSDRKVQARQPQVPASSMKEKDTGYVNRVPTKHS